MSVYNRDYMRDESHGSRGGPATWGLIPWLIAINCAVFLFTLLIQGLDRYLALSVPGLKSWLLWTPLTFQFTHADIIHLLFNMVGLYFLGRFALSMFAPGRLLSIYLWGGLVGAILHFAVQAIMGVSPMLLGASGSVLAILGAVATRMPNQVLNLMLFFVIPVRLKLKQIAYFALGINGVFLLLSMLAGPAPLTAASQGRTAYAAHLGGMLLGFLYVKFWIPNAPENSLKNRFRVRIIKDDETTKAAKKPKKEKKKKPFVGKDVDAILDKINEHGFQSLTAEEKKTLEKGSKKLNKRISDEP